VKRIDIGDIDTIAEAIQRRQAAFDESFPMSVGVVLMNYGDRYVSVHCIGGEWDGVKGDLAPTPGLPLCPNGHPLIETGGHSSLALVEDGADPKDSAATGRSGRTTT
jgi:hypothetical protein